MLHTFKKILKNECFSRAEQESYMNLLRKYLETIYPKEMAKANFAMLMKQLQYTRSISEVHVRLAKK